MRSHALARPRKPADDTTSPSTSEKHGRFSTVDANAIDDNESDEEFQPIEYFINGTRQKTRVDYREKPPSLDKFELSADPPQDKVLWNDKFLYRSLLSRHAFIFILL